MPVDIQPLPVPAQIRNGEREVDRLRDAGAPLSELATPAARLAMLCLEVGRYEEALSWARTLLVATEALPSMRLSTLSFIGAVYGDLGQHERAARCLREVLALDPRDAGAWFNLANALGALKRYGEALDAAERAVALAPQNGAYRVRLGSLLWDKLGARVGVRQIQDGARMLDDAGLESRFERMWRWIAARLLDDATAVARVEPLLFPKETVH